MAAEQEAEEYRSQAMEWKVKYMKEREKLMQLREELSQVANHAPSTAANAASDGPRGLPSKNLLTRRNTVPPSVAREWVEAARQISRKLEASPSLNLMERSESNYGTINLSTLSSTLAACLLLQGVAQPSSIGGHSHHHHHIPSQHDSDHSTVSVADDGRSGVGATAAAAVSVALAQSWAAVAGGARSSTVTGATKAMYPGKARFKLVAAVPRNLSSRRPERGIISGTTPAMSNGNYPEIEGTSPPRQTSALPPESSLALESIDDAAGLDDSQEATWRASGSHLKLHWLSAPSTVLVVYKPVPEVLEATAGAIAWLMQRGIKVYIEPDVYEDVRRAARAVLHPICSEGDDSSGSVEWMERLTTSGSAVFGEPDILDEACAAQAVAEEAAREANALGAANVDDLINRLLLTWTPIHSACTNKAVPLVPVDVAHRLDLVLTLGGDGTVLWACSLFGNGSVPPIVPLAMGSLGFMTPFPLARMESVLSRVTSVAHGFPLMLRHRLQCRIFRAGSSVADLSPLSAAPCSEDVLVLNEIVIDRGMTASLANLQCFVDKNFVTTIQGDGLIVSTPTGSTAYNLAAGGSMVHPSVPCILFTPICAHTLSSRPLVFPEHVTLRVKVPSTSRAEAYCSFDGRGREILRPGDSVVIHVSQWPVPMVCNLDSSHDWFLSVREGLNWNRRAVQKPM